MEKNQSRRQFFKTALMGMAAVPFLKMSNAYAFLAKSCPQGAPKDPKIAKKLIDPMSKTAKRLHFHLDAAKAHGEKKFKKDSYCGKCKFYRAHKGEEVYGKCSMMANRYVPSCGWCKSYRLDKKKA